MVLLREKKDLKLNQLKLHSIGFSGTYDLLDMINFAVVSHSEYTQEMSLTTLRSCMVSNGHRSNEMFACVV